jgi:hypothetical protein
MNRFIVRAFAAGVLFSSAACGDSTGADPAEKPKAFIRFVNAMPDTLGVDFHAVDIVENSPYIATLFREIKQAGYSPVASGARHFREFLSNPAAATGSTVSRILVDTTMMFAEGAHYTLMHAGFARAGGTPAAKFVIVEDHLPAPPAGQIAIRVVNLAVGMGSVDIYASASSTGALPATPLFAAAAFLAPTAYVNVPIGATLSLRATLAGAGTLATPFATVVAPVGDAGTKSLDPIPGSSIAGSVFTVYVFSRSSPGTLAPQGAEFLTPALVVVPDVQLHNRPAS